VNNLIYNAAHGACQGTGSQSPRILRRCDVEVRENGGPRCAAGQPIVGGARRSGKTASSSVVRRIQPYARVLAITDYSEQHLILAVERFGRSKPDRLEFVG